MSEWVLNMALESVSELLVSSLFLHAAAVSLRVFYCDVTNTDMHLSLYMYLHIVTVQNMVGQ